MPAFYGICTTLESQYDVKRVPEYMLPSSPSPAQLLKNLNMNGDGFTEHPRRAQSPVEEVHVPIYPNSQFWLSYLIVPHMLQPPRSPSHRAVSESLTEMKTKEDKIKHVYFKLILPSSTSSSTGTSHGASESEARRNDDSTIVSWGVGAKEGWKGKTMFGLFKSPTHHTYHGVARSGDGNKTKVVDKRGFWFSDDIGGKEGGFEVQVFRARGRRRESRVFPEVPLKKRKKTEEREGGDQEVVRLVNTGRLKSHQPQRYYQYALLDPVDRPYVTFRYHLRSMDHLNKLGIFPQPLLNPMTTRFYCPSKNENQNHENAFRGSNNESDEEQESTSINASAEDFPGKDDEEDGSRQCRVDDVTSDVKEEEEEADEECHLALSDDESQVISASFSPSKHSDFNPHTNRRQNHEYPLRRRSFSSSATETGDGQDEGIATGLRLHRLSIPPSIRLIPSSSFNEPHSPAKDLISKAKEPVKPPFVRLMLDSGSESSVIISPIPNTSEQDIVDDVHSGSEDDFKELARRPSPGVIQSSRDGSEITRRGWVLRTPSPMLEHSDKGSSSKGDISHQGISTEKREMRDVTPPSTGRRAAGGRFLIGVLESALRRREARGAKRRGSGETQVSRESSGERQASRETGGDSSGEGGRKEKRSVSDGDADAKGETNAIGGTRGLRGKYVAVRNSF